MLYGHQAGEAGSEVPVQNMLEVYSNYEEEDEDAFAEPGQQLEEAGAVHKLDGASTTGFGLLSYLTLKASWFSISSCMAILCLIFVCYWFSDQLMAIFVKEEVIPIPEKELSWFEYLMSFFRWY